MSTRVFLLGATGYIGGAIGAGLLKSNDSYEISAFTRSERNAPALEKAGLKPLIGTGDDKKDLQLFSDAAADADIVINAADADNLEMTKAILSGLKNTKRTSGLPILLHTSGTGVVTKKPTGSFDEDAKKVWDDSKVEDIRSIEKDQPHREIDLEIFNEGKKNYFVGYIIAPSTIHGVAHANPVHKISQQVPDLLRVAIKKRKPVYPGAGTNKWNNVHIEDLVDLYLLLLKKGLTTRENPSSLSSSDPYERFYWGSAAEHVWGDVARAAAPILYKRGLVDTDKAESADPSEFSPAVCTNSRTVANRGFADGWKPSRPDVFGSLEEDLEGLIKEDGIKTK